MRLIFSILLFSLLAACSTKYNASHTNFYKFNEDVDTCIKKSCKQMLNCEEAYFQYQQCGNTSLDRDKDGIPCESICN